MVLRGGATDTHPALLHERGLPRNRNVAALLVLGYTKRGGYTMRRLVWIGSPFFSDALRAAGWEVFAHDFQDVAVFGWDDLVAMAGWEPDVVVVADKSRPPFVLGVENFPCHTVLYCVDTHIHSWYPYYAQAFDACMVSLRDHIITFTERRLPDQHLWWSPAYARDTDQPQEAEKQWDCLFVGTVSRSKTPRRYTFLNKLAKRMPLHVTQGAYRELYPRARVVLNYCELGDLNFRVFEALGCGACLLTPHVEHGFGQMFRKNVDLGIYKPDDVDDVVAQTLALLESASTRQSMAANGLATINAAHRACHRAQTFTERVRALPADLPAKRCAEAGAIRKQWLRMVYLLFAEHLDQPLLREAYCKAASKQGF